MHSHHGGLRYTIVYVDDYNFDEESYANLAALGIGWQTVIAVLRHGKPRLTRRRGRLLQVASRTPDNQWMVVSLADLEPGYGDEQSVVRHARYLEPDEVANVEKVLTMWRGREQ